ncbi:MAG: N-acetyltransferase [Saprospiraceae bacterium]
MFYSGPFTLVENEKSKKNNMIEIKRASLLDAGAIAMLGTRTFQETFGHLFSDQNDLLDYCKKTFSIDKIANGITKESNIFWLAFYQGTPVGYAKLKLCSTSPFIALENICQLQKIYVLKAYLSKKIGHQLQNQLLEKAKEMNFEKIWLSVLKENKRAVQFYEKHGFQEIGVHTFSIGKEVFAFQAMAKTLI